MTWEGPDPLPLAHTLVHDRYGRRCAEPCELLVMEVRHWSPPHDTPGCCWGAHFALTGFLAEHLSFVTAVQY